MLLLFFRYFSLGGSPFEPTANIHNYIGNLRLLCRRLGKIKIYFPPFEAWRRGVNSVLYLPRQGKHCFLQRKAVLSGGESIAFLFFTIRLPQTSKGNSRRGHTSLLCPAGSLPASQDLNGGLLSQHEPHHQLRRAELYAVGKVEQQHAPIGQRRAG